MNRFRATAAGVALLAMASFSFAFGFAPAGAEVGGAPETITLVEVLVSQKVFDVGKEGPSPGDSWVLHGSLLDEDSSAVGSDESSCILTNQSRGQCWITLRLSGGQIVGQGLVRTSGSTQTWAVTGGTGAFTDVGGQIHLDQISFEEATLTIDLLHLAA
jgi:hypothetical protein